MDDDSDDDNKYTNNIGDISNSKINKIEQRIENYIEKIELSSDMPDEFKEPLQMWLTLSLEDLEWKKVQRAQMEQQAKEMERMARAQEKAGRLQERSEFINQSASFHTKWIYPVLIGLLSPVLLFFYLLPLYHTEIEPKLAGLTWLQKLSVWIDFFPKDTATQLKIYAGIFLYFILLLVLALFIAHIIAKKRAKHKFKDI